jgi:uncharacterized membrane protein YecN with MAPEG domain
MNLEITALYAALLGLLFILLSANVSRYRFSGHVSLGDGNNPKLAQAVRAHGNFAEYVPLALILIGLMEVAGAKPGILHAFGVALVVGRLLHAWGITQPNSAHGSRKIGISLTWLVIFGASIFLLVSVIAR